MWEAFLRFRNRLPFPHGEAPHPSWGQQQQVPVSGVDDADMEASYNKRSMAKWERDEALGDMASISPVLYANVKHPELKMQYPGNFVNMREHVYSKKKSSMLPCLLKYFIKPMQDSWLHIMLSFYKTNDCCCHVVYSGPCDLRPPSILRLTISDTTHMLSK